MNAHFVDASQSVRMKDSLSILFPVRNQQESIASRVEDLLEHFCEISNDVQMIVVDDASGDATPEVLDDLRRKYPQIEVQRKQAAVGPTAAVESNLHLARGDFIFLHQSYDPIEMEEVKQLWSLRKDDQLVIARAATRVRKVDHHLVQRLQEWGRKLEENWPETKTISGGLQMMKRVGLTSLSGVKDTLEELEVTHQSHRRIGPPNMAKSRSSTVKPFNVS
jgi:glycosyltransferase involved in cell wall biosynthesis